MEEKNKQLLITDLCARLPYGVWVECCGVSGKLDNIWLTHFYNGDNAVVDVNGNTDFFHDNDYFDITKIKPYLRPLTTMTDDEAKEFDNISESITIVNYQQVTPSHYDCMIKIADMKKVQDWFAKKHFDTAGLIEKGLAVEAPEGMY